MDKSPLGRVSPEVRIKIYELAFTAASPLDLSACLRGKGSLQHPLTRTCTKIRQESLLLFYSSTDFELHDAHEIANRELRYSEETPEAINAALWLFSVHPTCVDAIRSIGFCDQIKLMSANRHRKYAAEKAKQGLTAGHVKRMVGNQQSSTPMALALS